MTVGVDVSKDTLVWCALNGKPASVRNEEEAIRTWLATLPVEATIAMEATGRYHRLLAQRAVEHGCRVLVLNPYDVHHYAQSLSPRATTDPIMAQVIAEFVTRESHKPLHAYQPAPADMEEIRTLVRVRLGMVQESTRLRHQRREAPAAAEWIDPLLQVVQAQITAISTRVTTLMRTRPAFAWLKQIPGIGDLNAAYLLMLLGVHPFQTSDAFVAFLGWDLRIKDSGKERKRHCLTKRGDPEARRLLFLAARAAARCAAPFQQIYQRAIAAHYSTTEAGVIVARKLARVAWSVVTHETRYDPARVHQQA